MIPQFTGDLDALEQDKNAITAAAGTFRDAGSNVDSEFQGLSAFYSAPEAAQLFATTKPVKTDSDFFADQLESAATALGEYITEARPIVARLKELQAKASTFSSKISGDAHWKDDGDKIDENNVLIHDVNAAVSAFWAAERTCANKIRALYCAPPLTADDGSHGANMHGYLASDLNKAQDLPWGSQLEETHRAWEIGYWAKSFVWDGIVVDGIWGTIRGLGTLVGVDGLEAAGQAWTGLAKLATGLALTTYPGVGTAFWMADDKQLPSWLRDSRNAMKETGKALVAWDEWGKNPARAAGAVTFNVLTTVFTGGAGTATKAGTAAKVISVAGKVGRIIDPITYIGKAGSLAKLKVGELFANLGKVDGAFPKVDDVVWKDLPKADAPGITFPHPEDTVRLPDDALGRPQYYDKTTNQLLDHNGLPKQSLTEVPTGSDHPLAEVPKREPVAVGAGAHTADVTSHAPGGTADHAPGGVAEHTPGGVADNTVHNSHTAPDGGEGTPSRGDTDTASTGGGTRHADTSSAGGSDGSGPGAGGHDGPTVPRQGDGGDIPHQGEGGSGGDSSGSSGSRADNDAAAQQGQSTHQDPVVQRHVDLANNNPEWRRQHYRSNGRRLSQEGTDELGNPLTQLRETGDPTRPYTADSVQTLSPTYLTSKMPGDVSTLHPDYVDRMHGRASDRHTAIVYDNAAEKVKLATAHEFKMSPTPENELIAKEANYEYKSTHTAMGNAGEHLGEDAAEFHAIRDIDPNAVRLDDGVRGPHRFDQIWQTSNKRYLVVEAKASPDTQLGGRMLPGKPLKAKQGTPQYFDEIILKMRARGEGDLAQKLVTARREGMLDYIEVKANPVGDRYDGYIKRFFNIGRG
ncbi:protein phosphatase [Streptomyces lavendulae]|uniref:protein phosphatase n=1 Tax=Streptomyces lavendulae TaxID=1914 RepID=UPI0033167B26